MLHTDSTCRYFHSEVLIFQNDSQKMHPVNRAFKNILVRFSLACNYTFGNNKMGNANNFTVLKVSEKLQDSIKRVGDICDNNSSITMDKNQAELQKHL
jgi:hypothetical protein